MFKTWKTKWSAIVVSIMILITFSSNVAAQGSSNKQYIPKLPDSLSLGNNYYARLVNANIIPSNTGNVVMTVFRFYNGSNSAMDLTDYWIRYKKVGSVQTFTAKLLPADQNKKSVPPKTEEYIGFYTTTGEDVKLTNLEIQLIEWDFTMPNLEKVLGVVRVPGNSFVVPANEKYEVKFSGVELNTAINRSIISKNEKSYKASIYYTIENTAKTTIVIPELQFSIVTSEGIVYPLISNKSTKDSTLAPKTSMDLILRGNLSSVVNESGWSLVVSQTAGEAKEMIPVATYQLPKSKQTVGTDMFNEMDITSFDGQYSVKINSIYRLPLEDLDILSANITLTNVDSETMPLPALEGKFVLDGSVDRSAEVILPDKLIGIKPKQAITIYLYALIPYTFDFTDTKIVLQEKDSDEDAASSTLFEVQGSDVISNIRTIQADEVYSIDTIGNKSTFKLKSTRTYEGTTANIYAAQIDATNLEKRFTNVPKLAAYFKTTEGYIYTANVSEVKEKMAPSGRTLLDISAVVPQTVNMKDAVLILGEAVEKTTNTNNQNTTSMVSYVNPVEMQLPEEEKSIDSLTNINLYPFSLSISKISSNITYGEGRLNISFDYKFEKDPLVQSDTKDKKIVIEVKDEKNDIAFTNEYAIGATDKADAASFEIGNHQGKFSATDNELVYKIQTMQNNFTMNVYEQIQPGYKKLLASKELRWFALND